MYSSWKKHIFKLLCYQTLRYAPRLAIIIIVWEYHTFQNNYTIYYFCRRLLAILYRKLQLYVPYRKITISTPHRTNMHQMFHSINQCTMIIKFEEMNNEPLQYSEIKFLSYEFRKIGIPRYSRKLNQTSK